MRNILRKVKFLIYCYYKGHKFGVTKYTEDGETVICARCGYKKKRRNRKMTHDDFYIY